MTTEYITRKTSRLYEASTGGSRAMVLIFGDEVEITGTAENGRVPVRFRGRPGFVREDHLGPSPALEIYFIDVGQGDSTFIVTPGRKKILIDGGLNRRALGFLAWKYRLDHPESSVDIDLLVMSHADGDHLDGLLPVLEHPRIHVQRIAHSGIATFSGSVFETDLGDRDPTGDFLVTRHEDMDDLAGLPLSSSFATWRDLIVAKAVPCQAVDSTTGPLDVGDPAIQIDVLGPRLDTHNGQPVFRWLKNASHTINGHSVILRLDHDRVAAVFSGDLNVEGAKHLLADPALAGKMDSHVFKAPHHGSHEFHPPFLQAIRPQISVISSGDAPDHGHPRAIFIGGIGLASRSAAPLVFSTEIAATFIEADDPGGGALAMDAGQASLDLRAMESLDVRSLAANALARQLFKRRLHGMINVRSDGRHLYAARRVASGYWWESYGPLTPAPRPAD